MYIAWSVMGGHLSSGGIWRVVDRRRRTGAKVDYWQIKTHCNDADTLSYRQHINRTAIAMFHSNRNYTPPPKRGPFE